MQLVFVDELYNTYVHIFLYTFKDSKGNTKTDDFDSNFNNQEKRRREENNYWSISVIRRESCINNK